MSSSVTSLKFWKVCIYRFSSLTSFYFSFCLTGKGELVLVKQWRRAAREILIEVPAGGLEKGEDPHFCAKRELQEETGFRSDKITHLGGFYSAPGILSEYIHLYLAEKLVANLLIGDDTDEVDLIQIPRKISSLR
ncbi:MAG: NUDIX hydrolase [Candidatus Neptunochlamydia sp.]|nr:NUDIX hydrolase [Candidatus Neptunochlamydia sp.]